MKRNREERPYDVLNCIERHTPPDHKEKYRFGDMYSLKDHAIVRKAVQAITDEDECCVIVAAFWNDLSFQKIAEMLSIPEVEVLRIYDRALRRIREFCLAERNFSLSPPAHLPMVA